MCGIAGQVRPGTEPVDGQLLHRICDAIEHRGPDSRGTYVADGVGLGIQRLRVIDLETGDQPLFNEDRSVAVVLNGEIYNYRELRERLVRSGHRFASAGDTEVIAHLYEEEGPACVRSLHGMFAFAVWDARLRRLVLARDRVGKKPLFYAERDGALTFASELRALMRDPAISREIDYQAMDCFLAYGYIPAPLSAYKAVRKLPPASVLVRSNGRTSIERYWRLDYSAKRRGGDMAEIHEEIREAVRRSVRRRMVADVPLGAFLSGGIDSSTVVAAMAEASPEPVKTFSIGFASDSFNELGPARRVAELFATDHHELVVEPDAIELVPKVIAQYGEPFADSSALPSFLLAELTRRHVTVALNGDGGDESFAGYPRYASNALLGRFGRMPAPLRRGIGAAGRLLPDSGTIDSAVSRARRVASTLAMDAPSRYFFYVTASTDRRALIYTDELRELIGTSPARGILDARWRESTGRDIVDVMLDVDVNTYLPGDLLVKIDIATMAHSLEARSPLLDPEFMQLAASLPATAKVRGLEKKVALRDAMRPILPSDLLDRPKQGFQLPLVEWLRSDLREYVRDVLLDGTARARGYFRPEAVRAIVDRHQDGREDQSDAIWALLVFELWHRQYVDAPDPA